MVAAIDLLQINYQAFNPCENVLNPEALRSLAKVTLNHQPKIVEKLKLTSKKSFININLSKYINY